MMMSVNSRDTRALRQVCVGQTPGVTRGPSCCSQSNGSPICICWLFLFLGEVGGGGLGGEGHALSIEKDIGEFNKLWELNGPT